jgi:hypothetical protein
MSDSSDYAARLKVDYPDKLDRMTTFFRLILIIPILIILALITGSTGETAYLDDAGEVVKTVGGGTGGLFLATVLMIVFRQRYPRWWFNFAVELARFGARIGAYIFLLTDKYPSTVEEQSVHLEVDYPDVEGDLNQWLPLFKWFLAIPHYLVMAVLYVITIIAVILAWIAILVTGSYPRPIFDFVVGVGRWSLRVWAYAFLLVTDRYPPFSLT